MEITTLHALAWLAAGSAVGLLLSLLLLFPGLDLGPLTYGRWMPLHLNLLLYGWIALPLVALLFRAYRPPARAAAMAVQVWSASLLVGAVAWLAGETTGKQFLDWEGIANVFFLAALLFLAGVLAAGLMRQHREKIAGLAALWLGLLLVPAGLVWAASPATYPPVNPATGGPTVASLLWSTLAVVVIFLLVRYLLGARFGWPQGSRPWLGAFAAWGAVLLVSSAAMLALPPLLGRVKFTNALVGHAHLAMAGMATSFLALLLLVLNGETRLGGVLGDRAAFVLWNAGNAVQVLALTVAGALEAADPGIVFRGDPPITVLYALRAAAGAAMLAASVQWTSRTLRALS